MDTGFYWTLGNNVRSYRMQMGLTQEALAEKAHISAKGLQKVEAGKSGIRMDTFVHISEALTVSMDVLAGRCGIGEQAGCRQEIFCRLLKDMTAEDAEYVAELVSLFFYLHKKYKC